MKTTVVVPTSTLQGQGVTRQEAGEGKVGGDFPRLGYHAGMALLVCGFVLLFLLTVTGYALYRIEGLRAYWWDLVVIDVVLVSGIGMWFGVRWIREAATRLWRVEDAERERRWRFEDAALEEGDTGEAEEPRSEGWRLELAGYRILVMHYVEGLACTRPECEAAGIGQGEWNGVNEVLKALGVKAERRWMDGVSYTEALKRWNELAYFEEDGGAMVRTSESQWKRIL